MIYKRLLKADRIRPYSARPSEIQQLLLVAKRDLNTAEQNLEHAPDARQGIKTGERGGRAVNNKLGLLTK